MPDLAGFGRAAASDAPVLLIGESGTGRSSLAREIHRLSPFSAGPMVEVDPGTVPASLFEAELFGHRAGAFTGADAHRLGRVGRAEGGSLVLDHVEEFPLAAQPKFLRLLAEKTYAPLGGEERVARLRCIAIGSADLLERVERGAFRRDLFHRLEVLAFRVPSLRERRAEFSQVLEGVVAEVGERLGRPLEISPGTVEWMRDYDWPGNLRELRNVVERAALVGRDSVLAPTRPVGAGAGPGTLASLEEDAIRRALAHTGGRQGRAAEILGISRKSLWERRRKLGIP